MGQIKKMSAGFHRLRRAHFEKKKKPDAPPIHSQEFEYADATPIPMTAMKPEPEEHEPRKGRKPLPVKKYPRQTQDEWVKAERKRIFLAHIQQLARRKRQ